MQKYTFNTSKTYVCSEFPHGTPLGQHKRVLVVEVSMIAIDYVSPSISARFPQVGQGVFVVFMELFYRSTPTETLAKLGISL